MYSVKDKPNKRKGQNVTSPNKKAVILFIDMNSFFASCEQQENPVLRGKPIVVCGGHANGVIIAPSIEAKTFGVKTGMRLKEATLLCPHLFAITPHSNVYRKYHIGIMNVLRQFSEDVIPKSIDEAVVNLSHYQLLYPDAFKVAREIKDAIQNQVGEWLQCSIGIAPNTFLAKLATNLQKPNGLVQIHENNIDEILKTLLLTDLPGIAQRTEKKLIQAGIHSPFTMRHTSPEVLKHIMGGVAGYHWHYRLNFAEVDLHSSAYKSMSAVRTLSSLQRNNVKVLYEILLALCMKLESRLVHHHFFAKSIAFQSTYLNQSHWAFHVRLQHPIQDGTDIFKYLKQKIDLSEKSLQRNVFSSDIRTIGVVVNEFIPDTYVQYELFDQNLKRDQLRKTVYHIKELFGNHKMIKAVEMRETEVLHDIIGFGSVKDMIG